MQTHLLSTLSTSATPTHLESPLQAGGAVAALLGSGPVLDQRALSLRAEQRATLRRRTSAVLAARHAARMTRRAAAARSRADLLALTARQA